MKFNVYENSLILATNEANGPTLIELNYYKLDGEPNPRFHFNLAIPYITEIKNIEIDSKKAYLIGENIHFIYLHSIYKDFISHLDSIIFEFVDRGIVNLLKIDRLN